MTYNFPSNQLIANSGGQTTQNPVYMHPHAQVPYDAQTVNPYIQPAP